MKHQGQRSIKKQKSTKGSSFKKYAKYAAVGTGIALTTYAARSLYKNFKEQKNNAVFSNVEKKIFETNNKQLTNLTNPSKSYFKKLSDLKNEVITEDQLHNIHVRIVGGREFELDSAGNKSGSSSSIEWKNYDESTKMIENNAKHREQKEYDQVKYPNMCIKAYYDESSKKLETFRNLKRTNDAKLRAIIENKNSNDRKYADATYEDKNNIKNENRDLIKQINKINKEDNDIEREIKKESENFSIQQTKYNDAMKNYNHLLSINGSPFVIKIKEFFNGIKNKFSGVSSGVSGSFSPNVNTFENGINGNRSSAERRQAANAIKAVKDKEAKDANAIKYAEAKNKLSKLSKTVGTNTSILAKAVGSKTAVLVKEIEAKLLEAKKAKDAKLLEAKAAKEIKDIEDKNKEFVYKQTTNIINEFEKYINDNKQLYLDIDTKHKIAQDKISALTNILESANIKSEHIKTATEETKKILDNIILEKLKNIKPPPGLHFGSKKHNKKRSVRKRSVIKQSVIKQKMRKRSVIKRNIKKRSIVRKRRNNRSKRKLKVI